MPNLVGTGLNQVPTNGMLGGLAYQSPDHASIKDLDLKNLSQINSEIADTAVDIFIYDTSKDSDGGAWRHRTTHTSWYNETLNTSVRGSRREFPAVAVIVAESNNVKIYDGDDPDLPMWMVFEGNSSDMFTNGGTNYAVTALNGILSLGENGAIWNAHFISDRGDLRNSTRRYDYKGNIEQRNDGLSYTDQETSGALVNSTVRDVAMTVLPNAPIDDATGLPIPTIAVGTDGGLSVIKDDGTVVDIVPATIIHDLPRNIKFTNSHELYYSGGNNYDDSDRWFHIGPIPSSDISQVYHPTAPSLNTGYRRYAARAEFQTTSNGAQLFLPYDNGTPRTGSVLSVTKDYLVAAGKGETDNGGVGYIAENLSSPTNGMVAHITNNYNTGWMHGDIKGAFLSDTDATNVTGTELVTNGTFDSNVSGWTSGTSNTITWASGGYADVYRGGSTDVAYQIITTEIGKKYVISFDVISLPSNHAQVYVVSVGGVGSLNVTVGYRTTTGTSSGVFTADDTQTRITLYAYPGVTVRYDNVSVRLAEEDRSVNGAYVDSTNSGKGLQVFGTITKSAVATGAELVAYSGFSGSNYLQSPQGSISVGTSDFCLSIWYKRSTGSEINLHFDFIEGTANGFRLVPGNTVNDIYLVNGNFSTFVVFSGKAIGSGVWTHLSVVRDYGTNVKVYQNGILVGTTTTFASTNYNAGGVFKVSGSPDSSTCISLIRLSASAPSAEQIKKMYEDEKVLFQENAACTLYGSSDAVTALAYDEVTERLHVGTSSGRSEFQGLRRINNTTTAVTTAISAYDSFVVEQ